MQGTSRIFCSGLLLISFWLAGMEIEKKTTSSTIMLSHSPPPLIELCKQYVIKALAHLAQDPKITKKKDLIAREFPFQQALAPLLMYGFTKNFKNLIEGGILDVRWHPHGKHLTFGSYNEEKKGSLFYFDTTIWQRNDDFNVKLSQTDLGNYKPSDLWWHPHKQEVEIKGEWRKSLTVGVDVEKDNLSLKILRTIHSENDRSLSSRGDNYSVDVSPIFSESFVIDNKQEKHPHTRVYCNSPLEELVWGPSDLLAVVTRHNYLIVYAIGKDILLKKCEKIPFKNSCPPTFEEKKDVICIEVQGKDEDAQQSYMTEINASTISCGKSSCPLTTRWLHPESGQELGLSEDKKMLYSCDWERVEAKGAFYDKNNLWKEYIVLPQAANYFWWGPDGQIMIDYGDERKKKIFGKDKSYAVNVSPSFPLWAACAWHPRLPYVALAGRAEIFLMCVENPALVNESKSLSQAALALMCFISRRKEGRIAACPHSPYAHFATIFPDHFAKASGLKKLLEKRLRFSCEGCDKFTENSSIAVCLN